ncbi:MAG: hypothetical protein Kow0099_00760 [Candidatus Abyssubacteria bacterium]
MAKRYHPDCSQEGDRSCEKFREVQEAYERLGGFEATEEKEVPVRTTRAEPPRRYYGFAHPLFSASRFRLFPEEPDFEVMLTPREASLGTTFTLQIPVDGTCPKCGGFGLVFLDACPSCRGGGVIRRTRTVTIRLPSGLSDGTHIKIHMGVGGPTIHGIVRICQEMMHQSC